MTAENLPVLYQNVLLGLPCDLSRKAFLWATERPGEDRMCYRSESYAREVARLVAMTEPMLKASAKLHGLDAPPQGLMAFILKRHTNFRYGGNQQATYLEARK